MTTPLQDFTERFNQGEDDALVWMLAEALTQLRERLDPADSEIIAGWLVLAAHGGDPFRTERRGRPAGGRNTERGIQRKAADHDNLDIAYAVHRRIMASEPKMEVYKRVGRAYDLSVDRVRAIYRENKKAMPSRVIGYK